MGCLLDRDGVINRAEVRDSNTYLPAKLAEMEMLRSVPVALAEWTQFRNGDTLQRLRLTDQLEHLNYWDRIIFYVDKPE